MLAADYLPAILPNVANLRIVTFHLRLIFIFCFKIREAGWADDLDPFVLLKNQQILVTSNNAFGLRCDSRSKHLIIVRNAANRLIE